MLAHNLPMAPAGAPGTLPRLGLYANSLFRGSFPRPNNHTIGTWALSQVLALRDAGHEVRVVAPVPRIPVLAARLLGRGTSAACPFHHSWDGVEIDYVRWLVYTVGPMARLSTNRPGPFVKLAWLLAGRRFVAIAEAFSPEVIFAHHGQFSGFIASKLARLRIPYFISEHEFRDMNLARPIGTASDTTWKPSMASMPGLPSPTACVSRWPAFSRMRPQ